MALVYSLDSLNVLSEVAARLDESVTHDVLCIDCHGYWVEDLLVAFQKRHPYMPAVNIDSKFIASSIFKRTQRKASIVLVSCIFDGQCTIEQLEKSYIKNKYSIHFQLFNNASQIELDKALQVAKQRGLSLVVQLVDNQNGNTHLKPPLAQLPNLLLNGTLTKLNNFVYHVAAIPMSTSFFVLRGRIVGFEVDIFRLIIERQKARAQYIFSKPSDIAHVLQQLYGGQIDLLLNVLQTKDHYNFVRAFWQEHRPYCINLPKKLERMHLELLLHPFEWQIWFVFLGVLSFMQLVNLIFPTKFNHNLIMMCFFGSGPSEHVLPSSARLMKLIRPFYFR
uniref:Uncharacterized protein n=1 Tax=Anopheles maculatus TaxID=74869 RepID=A0A182T0V1_9DIPT